jgi:hypothetical protein
MHWHFETDKWRSPQPFFDKSRVDAVIQASNLAHTEGKCNCGVIVRVGECDDPVCIVKGLE